MMFVKQLNLNKSKLAWHNLCQMLQKEKQPSIFCLQEPYYTKNGLLTGIPKNIDGLAVVTLEALF